MTTDIRPIVAPILQTPVRPFYEWLAAAPDFCPICTETVDPLEWAYYGKHEDC